MVTYKVSVEVKTKSDWSKGSAAWPKGYRVNNRASNLEVNKMAKSIRNDSNESLFHSQMPLLFYKWSVYRDYKKGLRSKVRSGGIEEEADLSTAALEDRQIYVLHCQLDSGPRPTSVRLHPHTAEGPRLSDTDGNLCLNNGCCLQVFFPIERSKTAF